MRVLPILHSLCEGTHRRRLRGARTHIVLTSCITYAFYGSTTQPWSIRTAACNRYEYFLTDSASVHGESLGRKGPSTQGIRPRRVLVRSHANFDASGLSDLAQMMHTCSIDTSVDKLCAHEYEHRHTRTYRAICRVPLTVGNLHRAAVCPTYVALQRQYP